MFFFCHFWPWKKTCKKKKIFEKKSFFQKKRGAFRARAMLK